MKIEIELVEFHEIEDDGNIRKISINPLQITKISPETIDGIERTAVDISGVGYTVKLAAEYNTVMSKLAEANVWR